MRACGSTPGFSTSEVAATGSRSNRSGASGLRVQARSRSDRHQQPCADDPTAHLSHITRPAKNGILNGMSVGGVSRHGTRESNQVPLHAVSRQQGRA